MAATVPQPRSNSLASMWVALWALVLLAALGAGAIALERPTGQATGSVVAVVGDKPLVGATVTVSGPVTRHLLTGPDGHFRFADLPVGTYMISANHRSFASQFQENSFKVEEGAPDHMTHHEEFVEVEIFEELFDFRERWLFAVHGDGMIP